MKNLIIILIASSFFFSCQKEKITHTIKGQIVICYNTNNQVDYANSKIELYQLKDGFTRNGEVLAATTTDNNGNFIFTYSTTNPNDKILIRESTGFGVGNILTDMPLEDIKDLKVYYGGKYNLVVSLNVTKPYTSLDTLSLKSFTNIYPNGIIKVGPFVSGRVYTQVGVSLFTDQSYLINKLTYTTRFNGVNFAFDKDYFVENSKLCGDTVYVNVDIK